MIARASITAASLSLLASGSTVACPIYIDLDLNRIRDADAIAVGRVINFDPEHPQEQSRLDRWLAPNRSERNATDTREWKAARVTFSVKEVISGDLPPTVIVDWPFDWNNGPPDQMSGNYLFAVQNKSAVNGYPEPTYGLLHQGCSGSFVFRRGSEEANTIREMYGLWPERLEAEPKTLSDILKLPSVPWYILVATGILALLGVQIMVVLLRRDQKSLRG